MIEERGVRSHRADFDGSSSGSNRGLVVVYPNHLLTHILKKLFKIMVGFLQTTQPFLSRTVIAETALITLFLLFSSVEIFIVKQVMKPAIAEFGICIRCGNDIVLRIR